MRRLIMTQQLKGKLVFIFLSFVFLFYTQTIAQIEFDIGVAKQSSGSSSTNELKLLNPDFTNIDEKTFYSSIQIVKIASGDFNGDGRDDIAYLRNYYGVNRYIYAYKSDGNDIDSYLSSISFSNPTSSTNNNIIDITSGDFNGDGYDDLAVNFDGETSPNYYNYIAIYLSNGSTFSYDSYFKYGGYSFSGITAGDYNGDGLDDIAFYRPQGDGDPTTKNKFLIFINDDGSFGSDNEFWYAKTDYNREFNGISSGDIDGDGVDDLIFISDHNSDRFDRVTVYRSTISSMTHYFDYKCPESSASYYGIASGDFNGDFRDDVVVYRDKYTTYDPRVFILKFMSSGSNFVYTNSPGNYINLDYPIYDITAGEFNPNHPYTFVNQNIDSDITTKIASSQYQTYLSSIASIVNSYEFNTSASGFSISASVDETKDVNTYARNLKYAAFLKEYDASSISSKLSDVYTSIGSFASFISARKVNIEAENDIHLGIATKQTLDDAMLLMDLVLAYDFLFDGLNDGQKSNFKTTILIPLLEKQLGFCAGRSNHSDWHNASIVAGGFALRNKRYIGLGCKGTNISNHIAGSTSSGRQDGFWIGLSEQLSGPQTFYTNQILIPEIDYWGSTQNNLGTYISGEYFHDEGSTSYSRYSLMAMTQLAAIAKINNYPIDYFNLNNEAIDKICQTLISTIYPSLTDFPDINNERLGGGSRLSDATELILEILNRFIYSDESKDSPYSKLLDHSSNATCFEDLLYSEVSQPSEISGNPLLNDSRIFPNGGWGILRSDNPISSPDALHVTMDFGPYGKNNHGHADRLSINLFRKNSTSNTVLLRDLGKIKNGSENTYGYSSIIQNRWVESTISHNTVLINGLRQADPDRHPDDSGVALRPSTNFYSGSLNNTSSGDIVEHELANKHASNILSDLTNGSNSRKYLQAKSPFESSFGNNFEVSRHIELINDRYIVDEIDIERRNNEPIDFIDLFYHGPTDDLTIDGTVSTQSTIWDSELNSSHTSTYGYLDFNNAMYNRSSGSTKATWKSSSTNELTIWSVSLNSSNHQHIVNCFGPIEINGESVSTSEQHDMLIIRNEGFSEDFPEFLTVIDPYNEVTNVTYSITNTTATITTSTGTYTYYIKFNYLIKEAGKNDIPKNYSLSKNYPNPFNPQTNISFSLKESGLTSLIIYNSLGQEVETLVHDYKEAGSYQIQFDGSKLSSGIYFYTLRSGNFVETKKMIMMK